MDTIYSSPTDLVLAKKMKSDVEFIANLEMKQNPSRYFDSFEYELYLKYTTIEELENNYCSPETYDKICSYKNPVASGVKPDVYDEEYEEYEELDYLVKYVMNYYEPERASKTKAS